MSPSSTNKWIALALLVAARAVQGLGAALLSPAALSLVTVLFGGMLTEWGGGE